MLDGIRWRARLSETRTLLELERRLLLKGQMEELARLDRRRSELERHLVAMPDDMIRRNRQRVEEIRRLAARNHRLLSAYLEGARRAVARLAELEAARQSIGAYTRDGARIDGDPPKRRLQQKA
ncbi:MAG: hypothetical protein AAGF90_17745 [Pseudomonadota bacterium]